MVEIAGNAAGQMLEAAKKGASFGFWSPKPSVEMILVSRGTDPYCERDGRPPALL